MGFLEKLKSKFSTKTPEFSETTSVSAALHSATPMMSAAPPRPAAISRPPFEKFYVYGAVALSALMAADLTLLYFRDKMIPTSAPPARPAALAQAQSKMRPQYNSITARNVFNSDGLIPPALSQPTDGGGKKNFDGPAVPTSLPITLVGTIVHKNPGRSVATLELRGGKILPYVPNDEIEGVGTLLRVERKRAIFRNSQNGRNEFIEIKDKGGVAFGLRAEKSGGDTSFASGPGQTEFAIPRTEVNNYIKNLPELLQQARAEPNLLPGGKVDGFKIMDIMPGSIYEKLGIRVGDVVKGVNGEAVDSPAKAMELYQTLRTSNKISIEVDRNGNKETLTYTIN